MGARVEAAHSLPEDLARAYALALDRFDVEWLSSHGGLLTSRKNETRLKIAAQLAAYIDDPRPKAPSTGSVRSSASASYRSRPVARTATTPMPRVGMFRLAMQRLPGGTDLSSQETISRLANLPGPPAANAAS